MNASKNPVVVPSELTEALQNEPEAKEFFESLTEGYKRGYCDWVGGAKQEATRITRAGKALLMLQNKQKTLKT
ncbi:MAG: YdeI/OmpD-associated family protein [Oscillospiraceae bacterium]|nr:YdeI/OmpD-associated family protein [Oscillospiraceae bacterium]